MSSMASRISLPFLLSIFFIFLQLHFPSGQALAVVKSAYWYSGYGLPVSSINSTLFTHLFAAFADLDPSTYQATIAPSDLTKFSTFTKTLQQKNPSVKTLLSITGVLASSTTFSLMASNSTSRASFINSSITLARGCNFHGLDLDWEFPSTTTDMDNFALLLKEWRTAITNESTKSKKPPLILTSAVYYSSTYLLVSYPVQTMASSLDWVNVMAYSLSAPGWAPNMTKAPAGLYNPLSQVSGDSGVTAWLQAGLPAKKIVLGLPFYGFAWSLVDANDHGLFSPANGSAVTIDGALAYFQIMNYIATNAAQKVFNSSVVTDYCYAGTTWIGYDDIQSVSTKVAYAKAAGLLGYFAWEVTLDFNWTLSQTASMAWQV